MKKVEFYELEDGSLVKTGIETVPKVVVEELQKDISGYLVNLQIEIDNGSDIWKEKLPIIIHDNINKIFSEYIRYM